MSDKRRIAEQLRKLAEELDAEAVADERRELIAEFWRTFVYDPTAKPTGGWFSTGPYYIVDTHTCDASGHGYGNGRWYAEIDGNAVQSDNLEDVAVPVMLHIRSKS